MMNDSGNPNAGPTVVGQGQAGGAGGVRPITTTTTTTTTTRNFDWVKIDVNYFVTLPGILKLAQWFLGILCMILGSPAWTGGTHFFLFVVVLAFIVTFLWLCIYFFSIREGLQFSIPWVVLEFFYTAGAAGFYFIATIVQFSTGYFTRYIFAGVIGLINTGAYAAGAFFLYKDWKMNANTISQTNAH